MINKNTNENQEIRSLLQKAVRRGNSSLTAKAYDYLVQHNDAEWVRKRLPVIAFEECWGYGMKLYQGKDIEAIRNDYKAISGLVKNKDAAGLGGLAYELSKGDKSVLLYKPSDKALIKIAEGLAEPDNFWKWAERSPMLKNETIFMIYKAMKCSKNTYWIWDKAYALAATYLAITGEIPVVKKSNVQEIDIPLWVAIDKHTQEGKKAIRTVANAHGIYTKLAYYANFYFESALLNESEDSFWWNREITWRFKKLGVQPKEAQTIWNQLRPEVSSLLQEKSEQLENKLLWNLGGVTNAVLFEALNSVPYQDTSCL